MALDTLKSFVTPTTFADAIHAMTAHGIPEDVARAVIWNEIDSGRLHLDPKTMRVITTRE